MHKRHNFSKKTIEVLRSRVSGRCSNPDCRVPTTGPAKDVNKVNNIGIAAHIYAASPGGPRYDSSMTKEERGSIDNALLLCSNCSIKIDKDPDFYSAELLFSWKRQAEAKSLLELGNQLPDDNQTVHTLSAALTGFAPDFLANSVKNVCTAVAQNLQKLDPRFDVRASYLDGVTSFEFYARENVKARISVDRSYVEEFQRKYKHFVDYGERFKIDSDAVTFTGSKLFEKFSAGSNGTVEFSQNSIQAILKLHVVDIASGTTHVFDDSVGEITFGKKACQFSCSTYDGLLCIKLSKDLDDMSSNFTINTTFDFSKWNNCDVSKLKYFNKIYNALDVIKGGCLINVALEQHGETLLSGSASTEKGNQTIDSLYVVSDYIKAVRGIASYTSQEVFYDNGFSYSSETHDILYAAFDLIQGRQINSASEASSNARCTIVVNDQLLEILNKEQPVEGFSLIENVPKTVDVFGCSLQLPREKHTLTKVLPVPSKKLRKIKIGDSVDIEWVPVDECQYIVEVASD